MDDSKTQAEAYSLALSHGFTELREVVAWVDTLIAKADQPHWSLCEASVQSSSVAALVSALGDIPGTPDPKQVLRLLFGQMRRCIERDPQRAQSVARCLHRLALNGEVPEPAAESDMLCFDEDLALARDGVHGDLDAVRTELSEFLAKFESTV